MGIAESKLTNPTGFCGLIPVDTHLSWDGFLTVDRINCFEAIEADLLYEFMRNKIMFTPELNQVLRFLKLDLSKIRVVIMGQDPYATKGVANGRAFQPATLLDWRKPFRQASIRNIIKAIYAAYADCGVDELPRFVECLDSPELSHLLPPPKWFDYLEDQGVLWLNASYTCPINEPNGHQAYWNPICSDLVKYISQYNRNAVWFLWGKNARSLQRYLLPDTKVYALAHPRVWGATDFDPLIAGQFRETANYIDWVSAKYLDDVE